MPKAPPGLEQLLPDYLSVRILRRVSPFHLASQHERLVNQLDASERLSRDFAPVLGRLIPGGKVVTTAGKVAKRAVSAARVAKGAREAEEALKAAKAAKEAQENAKVAKDVNAATAASGGSGGKRGGKDTTIKGRKKGPCDHLRQGSGKGPYRGGAHGKTSRPRNDGKDSHHMPAKSISPLKSNEGPAIQMDPADHKNTSSYGPFKESDSYREKTKKLLQKKQWRKAMSMEIRDIRGIAKDSGEQRKYNEAMLEMLEYFKCLEKNGLLP